MWKEYYDVTAGLDDFFLGDLDGRWDGLDYPGVSHHVWDSMAWSSTGTGTGTSTDIGMTERAQRSNISRQGIRQHRSATLRRYTTVTVPDCSFEFHPRDWGEIVPPSGINPKPWPRG